MNKTILVIDDELSLQSLIQMALKSKGYTVELAGNGIEGLEKLKTLRPDLIILDMNMPKMGGVEFYQRICDKNARPQYPVLVLTARANMEQLFKQFNIDGFMAKPMEIPHLLNEVETIIKNRSSGSETKESEGGIKTKKICLIEDDPDTLNKIGSAFLCDGYVVDPARNGMQGIERAFSALPDIVLVKLDLVDISGDMVIMKLKNMAKTMNVKYVLYSQSIGERTEIVQKIAEKVGVDLFVEYTHPQELLKAVNDAVKI